jgi:hypothetical protein
LDFRRSVSSPFLYPKTKHKRTQTPPAYSTHQQYKGDLQKEFLGQCVYCRALDAPKGYESFGVDHYRPKSLFPELATEYFNLYYSCNRCNAFKGRFWPSGGEAKAGVFIPNPCEHVMFDHLRYKLATVTGTSVAGEFTVERLDINDPNAVEFRKSFIHALLGMHSQLERCKQTLAAARKAHASAATEMKVKLAKAVEQAEKNVATEEAALKGLLGLAYTTA